MLSIFYFLNEKWIDVRMHVPPKMAKLFSGKKETPFWALSHK